jgi:hypothetical protein
MEPLSPVLMAMGSFATLSTHWLGQAEYSRISAGNIAYPRPPSPPPPVPDIPTAGTDALLTEILLYCNNAKKTFQKYYVIDGALKKLLLATTDECFVISLKDWTHTQSKKHDPTGVCWRNMRTQVKRTQTENLGL